MKSSSKQHPRERLRGETRTQASHRRAKKGAATDIAAWRSGGRVEALAEFVEQTDGLKWTKRLLLVLLEELHMGDEFDKIIGPPETLPARRWPQAVALAIALRHSWRPDDFTEAVGELGARSRARTPSARSAR